MNQLGKYIIIAGVIMIVIGIIIKFTGGIFGWFGNLPGDINIKKDNYRFFAPLTSMILLSIALSLILWLIKKIL